MIQVKKINVLIVTLAIAGLCNLSTTQAAINNDNVTANPSSLTTGAGLGEIFFSIYDNTNNKSLTLDLNVLVTDFLADPLMPLPVSDPLLTAFLNTGDLAAMQWNIAGVNNQASPRPYLLSSAAPGSSPTSINTIGALSRAGGYLSAVNDNLMLVGGNVAAFDVLDTTGGYAGAAGWAHNFGNTIGIDNTANFDIATGAFETVSFFVAGLDSSFGGIVAQESDVPGVNNLAGVEVALRLIFDAGEITDVSLQDVSAIPVPAAIWLMGSAMLGLLGIRKIG